MSSSSETKSKIAALLAQSGQRNARMATESSTAVTSNDHFMRSYPLSMVKPDATNPRWLPMVALDKEQHFLQSRAEAGDTDPAYILLGKGVMENKAPTSHPKYKVLERKIKALKEDAETIRAVGLINSIEVIESDPLHAEINAGHRRYYMLVYLYGWEHHNNFKVLRERPANKELRQWAENDGVDPLTLDEKIKSFKKAYDELCRDGAVSVRDAAKQLGTSKSSVSLYLQLCRRDLLEKIERDPTAYSVTNVRTVLEDGITHQLVGMNKDEVVTLRLLQMSYENGTSLEQSELNALDAFNSKSRIAAEEVLAGARVIEGVDSDKLQAAAEQLIDPTRKNVERRGGRRGDSTPPDVGIVRVKALESTVRAKTLVQKLASVGLVSPPDTEFDWMDVKAVKSLIDKVLSELSDET